MNNNKMSDKCQYKFHYENSKTNVPALKTNHTQSNSDFDDCVLMCLRNQQPAKCVQQCIKTKSKKSNTFE